MLVVTDLGLVVLMAVGDHTELVDLGLINPMLVDGLRGGLRVESMWGPDLPPIKRGVVTDGLEEAADFGRDIFKP